MGDLPQEDFVEKNLSELLAFGREEAGRVSSDFLPLVYDELRLLATRRMKGDPAGHTLQPTALVHEAWMKLNSSAPATWESKAHFFNAATRAMRRILVDRARGKSRKKRQGCLHHVPIDDLDFLDSTPDDRVLEVEEALKKLEWEDSDLVRLVTLKFYGGLSDAEIASIEQVTDRTVRRRWEYARVRLYQIILETRLDA